MKERGQTGGLPDWTGPALVVWATIFNAVLAIVNTKLVKLSPAAVIGVESLTTIACYVLALTRSRPEMRPWWVLFGLLLVLFSLESLARGDLQVKNVRDVLIIPTFILLGMASPRRYLNRTVCIIHAIVLVIGFYEALDTDGYAKLFDVQSYYINTRGYEDDNFWNKQSDLFVSAVRPGDRIFLPFLDLHRLSSIFLEPVSLGNYCTIITVYICACFPTLSRNSRWFLIVGNVLVMIGCDGRLAGLSSILIAAVALLAPRTPRGTAVLYLPLTLLAAFTVTDQLGLRAGPDDLSGRIAHTVELLRQYDLEDMFALSDRFVWLAVDSGVAYLMMTQTIVGLCLIWIFIIFGAAEDKPEQVRYTHGLCLYLSLGMMVSFSMLTIKTAALLWFVQGSLQIVPGRRRTGSEIRPEPSGLAGMGLSGWRRPDPAPSSPGE